ncbi:MAG TPA: hypothetical protein VJU58_03995 [Microbacterium sp.]|nr:hypothetical protein [Microbacterium sp.]
MSDGIEMVEVYEVATPRLAPVEYVGRLQRDPVDGLFVDASSLRVGDVLVARPGSHGPWRTGRAAVVRGLGVTWSSITAICDGDHVYRIGKPTTPSLEERVAMLERLVYPDLVIADDAEKSGRPEVAAELRARVPWWREPGSRT